MGAIIAFIFLTIVFTAFFAIKNEIKASAEEKRGGLPEHNRVLFMPKTGPHAFEIGDRVAALDPAARGFISGTVLDLYWRDKPSWYPAADTTMPVRDDATGQTIWVGRSQIVKVA